MVQRVEALDRLGLDREWIRVFVPLVFNPGPRPGTMVPFYPVGVPLHAALAALLGGWARAPFLVSPAAALLALVLLYLVARELGLSPGWCGASAAILGLCPFNRSN